MVQHRWANPPRAKIIFGFPLIIDPVFSAIRFDFLAAFRSKYGLPSPARQIMVVAHKHPSQALKFVAHVSFDSLVYLSCVDYRCLSSLLRRQLTPKDKPAW